MGRPHNAGAPVGKQQRRAIGGQRANGNAGMRGDKRIGPGARAVPAGAGHTHNRGGMHLMQAHQRLGRHAEMRRHKRAVLRHGRRVIMRAYPAIQPLIQPARMPAGPGHEPVLNARKQVRLQG